MSKMLDKISKEIMSNLTAEDIAEFDKALRMSPEEAKKKIESGEIKSMFHGSEGCVITSGGFRREKNK